MERERERESCHFISFPALTFLPIGDFNFPLLQSFSNGPEERKAVSIHMRLLAPSDPSVPLQISLILFLPHAPSGWRLHTRLRRQPQCQGICSHVPLNLSSEWHYIQRACISVYSLCQLGTTFLDRLNALKAIATGPALKQTIRRMPIGT